MNARDLDRDTSSPTRDRSPDRPRDHPPIADREDEIDRDRDALTRGLDLPRGAGRERVHVRGAAYELRGSETRILATAATFRVVPADELRDGSGHPLSSRSSDLRHLKELGLVRLTPHPGRPRTMLISLTDRGRTVLTANRSATADHRVFYANGERRRELAHDANLHRAYRHAAERIAAGGGRIHRVVLEDELRRDYQSFLQESNRGRSDSDGTVTRTPEEINAWAESRDLTVIDGHLRIPDVRIEYDAEDGTRQCQDVEVTTEHYRGAHAAATAKAGFACYRAGSVRLGGKRSGGGAPFDPRAAERLLP